MKKIKKAEEELLIKYTQAVELIPQLQNSIVEIRITDQASKENEDRFKALVTASSEVLYRMSPDWSEMNQLQSRGFLANTERPNRNWLQEYIPLDEQPLETAAINKAIGTKSVFELEHRVYQEDGSIGWMFSRAVPILDLNGEIVEWFGVASDITKRKQAEEKLKELNASLEQRVAERIKDLRESEERYRGLFESIDEGFCVIQVIFDDTGKAIDYRFLEVNPEFERQTGLIEAQGKRMRELRPGHEEHWFEIYGHIALTGEHRRFQNRAKELHRWYDVYAWRHGQAEDCQVAILFNDITESKLAEEALRKSECSLAEANRQNEDILESISDCFYALDKDLRFTYVNKAAEEIWGLSRADLLGRKIEDVFVGQIDYSLSKFHQVLEEQAPQYYQLYSKVIQRWGEMSVYPGQDGISVYFHDITDRKLAEEPLRKLNATLEQLVEEQTREIHQANAYNRSLIEASLDPLVTIGPNGKITDVNTATEVVTGCTRAALIGTDFSDYFTDPAKAMAGYQQVFREGTVHDYPLDIRHINGHTTPVMYNASVYHDAQGKPIGVFAAARNVTELKRMEEENRRVEAQLAQAQRIDALDRFAGGIAHDMNNILYPMIINVEELLEGEPADSPRYDILTQTLKAAYRQRDLIKKILSFGRRSEQAFQPVNVKPIIEETISFLRSSIPKTIDILLHMDVHCDVVMGDAIQIQQVIMNLCQNAADAFESGKGTIEVKLTVTLLANLSAHPDLMPGDYLIFTVRDNGSGMTRDVMNRVFEPFFTTKGIGNGYGLGLSVVHGIVKNHKGAITVKSTEGEGSLFTVYLPVCDEEYQARACSANIQVPLQGKGKILLIDDEELILSSLRRTLKSSGYDVQAMRDSIEALRVFKEKPDEFDLVITDLTMPGMTGVELAREITGIRSDIPITLCTGFNDVISRDEARAYGIRELIHKPASIRELKEVVHRVLENGFDRNDPCEHTSTKP